MKKNGVPAWQRDPEGGKRRKADRAAASSLPNVGKAQAVEGGGREKRAGHVYQARRKKASKTGERASGERRRAPTRRTKEGNETETAAASSVGFCRGRGERTTNARARRSRSLRGKSMASAWQPPARFAQKAGEIKEEERRKYGDPARKKLERAPFA